MSKAEDGGELAERKIRVAGRGSLVIKIFRPTRSGRDYQCSYAISLGKAVLKSGQLYGADPIQALIHCLAVTGIQLEMALEGIKPRIPATAVEDLLDLGAYFVRKSLAAQAQQASAGGSPRRSPRPRRSRPSKRISAGPAARPSRPRRRRRRGARAASSRRPSDVFSAGAERR